MPRRERQIVRIAGIGGAIRPFRFDAASAEQSIFAGDYLEISEWRVRHVKLLVEDTHSGSNSAVLRSVVAQDWQAAFAIPWNARLSKEAASRGSVGFLEEILIGTINSNFYVSMLFELGDALSYNQEGAGGQENRAFYWGKKMLFGEIETINDNTGRNIIRMNCRGQGSSLLKGYRGNVLKFGDEDAPAEPVDPVGA